MNLTLPKKSLLAALAAPVSCSERKSPNPILSNVLLSCDGAELTVSGTDLYIGASTKVPVDKGTTGSIAVPGKELVDRVKMMPDGQIVLEAKENALTLRAAGKARRYTLRGMPGTDFPQLPQPAEGAPTLAIEPAVLSSLIEKVGPSVSPDETRAHLNSMKVEWEGEVVKAISTDGHRLTLAEAKVDGVVSNFELLIPLKGVQEIRRFCESASGDVTLVQGGRHLFLSTPGATISTTLTDAQFPPYQQVIPKGAKDLATLPASQVLEVVKAVAVASNEKTAGVKLTFSESRLRVSAESPETGEAEDFVEVDDLTRNLAIGMNAKYLCAALAACIADQGPEARVSVAAGGELDPMLLTCGAVTVVLMPMRTT